MLNPKISIIIPTYNEAQNILKTLERIRSATNIEIILVDGGSTDQTLALCKDFPRLRSFKSAPGRAVQQNFGAQQAIGDYLLFLHADCLLPGEFDQAIREILGSERNKAGAFRFKVDHQTKAMAWIENLVNLRCRLFQLPYGDQGIFLSKELFHALGGFPNLPIMEDYEFIRKIKKVGKISFSRLPLITSARRWQQLGIWKTTWINQRIIFSYHLGVSPHRLKSWYRNQVTTKDKERKQEFLEKG